MDFPKFKRTESPPLSIVNGSTWPRLRQLTLGQLTDQLSAKYGPKTALIVDWSHACLSFRDLSERSRELAKGLLAMGISKGDRVAVFSGDDERYVELLLAVGRIGAILVILNKSYTAQECEAALRSITDTDVLFLADTVYRRSTIPLIEQLHRQKLPTLRKVVLTRWTGTVPKLVNTWEDIITAGSSLSDFILVQAESKVDCKDTVNFQFTSGTTGTPKAAMLSHFNIINNGRLTGDRLGLTPEDIVCSPPPLFHCFGIVIGFMAAFTHGVPVVFGSQDFDPAAIVHAVIREKCTVMHGVPTMFSAVLEYLQQTGLRINTLRTGIVGGSKVPPALLTEVRAKLGYQDIAVAYGMTETSPVSFMTESSDTIQQKLETVGRVLPHTSAKVVDNRNRVLPRGERGELCISGYLLQQGYYKNPEKTAEAMIYDENGVVWMHTGDEACIDEHGYCTITGRIKDLIIRGGENIHPLEIEERLISHPAINQVSIVGLKDEKYGESVAAFLQLRPGNRKVSPAELRAWVRDQLGHHKEPRTLIWVGSGEYLAEFPTTASGKIRKDILREVGNKFLDNRDAARTNKL
ncbi:hypothetical protein F5884DRAFT_868832 [Xylogone sp. PMI_703]|nr:hypothetical protein F5884DRAFT_868832 [Xylogone sp. PMI_703]